MRTPQLTLPGLIALIAVALVLAYVEKHQGGGTPSPSAPSSAPRTTPAASGGSGGDEAESGDFDYYALVLAWSPTHCETPEGADDDAQCAPRDGRRYGFILHGLWPQYERGYPESCPTRGRPWVPDAVIAEMRDIMPEKGLIIHEYRKHGTCSGLSPTDFYGAARRMFESIRIPDRFRSPTEAQFLSPRDVVQEFVTANPALKPAMLAVGCGGPGSRLREVRICFTKAGAPRACGANEDQGQLCRSGRMHVPPVRGATRY